MSKPETRPENENHHLRLCRPDTDASYARDAPPAGQDAGCSDRTRRELDRVSGTAKAKTVSVSVRSLIPLLVDAAERDRTWLRDFADDPVRIDVDLYDVLLAYQKLSQTKAA